MMVRKNLNPKLLTLPTRVMLALMVGSVLNTSPAFAADLPGSKEIIAKMIEAVGGAAAMRKVKNRVVKMDMDMDMGGMTAKIAAHFARPNSQHTSIEIAGMGTIEEGVSGGVAWANSMMTGPQIKEGSERAVALWGANMDGLLDWKSHFKKIECVGKETLDGVEYFKVVMTRDDGSALATYVNAKTYLPHRTDMKLSTAMGEFDMVTYSEDYRPVDGVLYSYKSRIEVMGQTRSIAITSIEHNVDMPKDVFNLPDDIKELVAKNKADKDKAGQSKAGQGKP